ncbi:hypothetical protein DFH94DRAFT_797338 [Russula ochroleuca]|uniref:Uncharacterized protein n=1 Tax=Russula ochroleuca TaxID=152965 RepID=A0A9P5TED2_9AGAM|nr:hypothetical protein DFH94DRAFT_797338 [Russula ochroleuca]
MVRLTSPLSLILSTWLFCLVPRTPLPAIPSKPFLVRLLLVFKITLSIIVPKSTQEPLIHRTALVEVCYNYFPDESPHVFEFDADSRPLDSCFKQPNIAQPTPSPPSPPPLSPPPAPRSESIISLEVLLAGVTEWRAATGREPLTPDFSSPAWTFQDLFPTPSEFDLVSDQDLESLGEETPQDQEGVRVDDPFVDIMYPFLPCDPWANSGLSV